MRGKSHPLRVRGLKLRGLYISKLVLPSHPLRVRGLKHLLKRYKNDLPIVAPFAGAWIETVLSLESYYS